MVGFPLPNPLGLVSWVFNGVKTAATNAAAEIVDWMVNITLSGVGLLFSVVWGWVDGATTPNVMAAWFSGGIFAIAMRLAVMTLFAAVMFTIALAIWNRDLRELHYALLNQFPRAMWNLSTLLLQITIGIGLADAITTWFLSVTGDGASNFAERMIRLDTGFDLGFGVVFVWIMALAVLVGLLVVAVMLFAREGLTYVFACVTALAEAGDVYQPWRGGGGRAKRLLWGIIAMKPLIALCFAIGGSALGGTAAGAVDALAEPGTVEVVEADPEATPGEQAIAEANGGDLGDVTTDLFAALAVTALAALAPFSIMRLFPFEGTEAAHEMGGELAGKAKQSASRAAQAAAVVGSGGSAAPAVAASAARSNDGGGGAGGGAAGAAMGKAAS